MSEIPPAMPTLAERRERLALACELDRLRLRLALRPPARPAALAGADTALSLAGKALSVAGFFPGKIGRWARRLSLGSELLGAFNPFAR
jgi:hypothetical protein